MEDPRQPDLDDRYVLSRDGHEVLRGNWFDAVMYIHDHHSFSFSWALAHEGYRMEREEPEPKP